MPERAILTAQQCAELLAAGHEYNVLKRVEPGYWLVDTTPAAMSLLERQAAPASRRRAMERRPQGAAV